MRVFISHSSENAELAKELCGKLEKNGFPCFLAPRDIRSGFEYAKKCRAGQGGTILAKPLDKFTKVFSAWNYEGYMSGQKGDFLCCTDGDDNDVYVVKRRIFDTLYEPVE